MKLNFIQWNRSRKLENAIFISIILFIFKVIIPQVDSISIALINDLLVFSTIYLWIIYLGDLTRSKINTPLSIVLNAGILTAVIFFIISVSSYLLEDVSLDLNRNNLVYTIFSVIISFIFIGVLTYIFTAIRELFFLRQKKDPKLYFNTMLIFIFGASLTSTFAQIETEIDFIPNALYVVSIVLISVNSLRVAWIAFLTKKQKIYLLIISTVLSFLFGINFALTLQESFWIINVFSPGLNTFLNLIMIYGTIYFAIIFFTTLFHLPTAEAFDRKAEEVSSLIDLSKLITQVFDFKELVDTVTSITNKVCNSQCAWLVIKQDDEYELSSVKNIGYVYADKITDLILKENSEDIQSLKIINLNSIYTKLEKDIQKQHFNSIAIAPLKVHNEIIGYLFAARKLSYSFDEDEKQSITAFADFASVALENAKLIEESLEKERLEKELDVAREIQYKILPTSTPEIYNTNISALFVPAFEVGGDYYDFFELEENVLGFVIADVSGKGISSAFIMAEVKGIFESLSKIIKSPKELLIKVNEILINSIDKKNFVTAIYGIINSKTGKLKFARAGHPPLLFFNDGNIKRLIPGGIGLGLDTGKKFSDSIKEMEIQLNNNDIITLFTDGINESQNENLEEFGFGRLEKILKENSEKNVDEISNEIMQAVTVFSRNKPQHDDITLVILKRKFNNKSLGEN